MPLCPLCLFTGLAERIGATLPWRSGRRVGADNFLFLFADAGFIKFGSYSNLTILPGVLLSSFSLSLASLFLVEDFVSSITAAFGDSLEVF